MDAITPKNGAATNGAAYPITDHTYDVVVVGRRRRGPARRGGLLGSRPAHRLRDQGVPDPLAHGGGAGRHRRGAGQYEQG